MPRIVDNRQQPGRETQRQLVTLSRTTGGSLAQIECAFLAACLQRRLYSCEALADRLALRGGHLLAALGATKFRPTTDTDFIFEATPAQREAMLAAIRIALTTTAIADGLVIAADTVKVSERGGDQGTRIALTGWIGTMSYPLRLDVVFVERLPEVVRRQCRDSLGHSYTTRTITPEAQIADKIECWERTSNPKHLWDVCALAKLVTIDLAKLGDALRALVTWKPITSSDDFPALTHISAYDAAVWNKHGSSWITGRRKFDPALDSTLEQMAEVARRLVDDALTPEAPSLAA